MRVLALILVALSLSSCMALTGVKSYETRPDGTSKTVFVSGADFSIGFNSVDNVTNRRGIQP